MSRSDWGIAAALYLLAFAIVTWHAVFHYRVIAADQLLEYQVYLGDIASGSWHYLPDSLVNSSLFVTLFPALFQRLVHIDADLLFKIFPGFFFAMMPAFVYLTARLYFNRLRSILAAALTLSGYYFVVNPELGRVLVGNAFAAGLMWSLLSKRFSTSMVFAVCLVFSFYGALYMMAALCGGVMVYYLTIWMRRHVGGRQLVHYAAAFAVLISGIAIWDGYVAGAPNVYAASLIRDSFSGKYVRSIDWGVSSLPGAASQVSNNPGAKSWLDGLVDLKTRSINIQMMFGEGWGSMTLRAKTEVISRWIVYLIMMLGCGLILTRKSPADLKLMVLFAGAFIGAAVLLPYLSNVYPPTIVQNQSMAIFGPAFLFGLVWIAERARVSAAWLGIGTIGMYGSSIFASMTGYIISAFTFLAVVVTVLIEIKRRMETCKTN